MLDAEPPTGPGLLGPEPTTRPGGDVKVEPGLLEPEPPTRPGGHVVRPAPVAIATPAAPGLRIEVEPPQEPSSAPVRLDAMKTVIVPPSRSCASKRPPSQ